MFLNESLVLLNLELAPSLNRFSIPSLTVIDLLLRGDFCLHTPPFCLTDSAAQMVFLVAGCVSAEELWSFVRKDSSTRVVLMVANFFHITTMELTVS